MSCKCNHRFTVLHCILAGKSSIINLLGEEITETRESSDKKAGVKNGEKTGPSEPTRG